MGERLPLGRERSKVLKISNVHVHVTNYEEGALPVIFVEVASESGATSFPYLVHIKAKAAGVIVALRVDGAHGDLAVVLELNSNVDWSSAAAFRIMATNMDTAWRYCVLDEKTNTSWTRVSTTRQLARAAVITIAWDDHAVSLCSMPGFLKSKEGRLVVADYLREKKTLVTGSAQVRLESTISTGETVAV
jgi:hypothetical protein